MAKQNRKELRLYGKELYIVYPKIGITEGNFRVDGYTNKRQLADGNHGLSYDNLVRIFTRNKKTYHEFEEVIVLRLVLSNVTKGEQSLAKKGRGGRDQFNKFIKKNDV